MPPLRKYSKLALPQRRSLLQVGTVSAPRRVAPVLDSLTDVRHDLFRALQRAAALVAPAKLSPVWYQKWCPPESAMAPEARPRESRCSIVASAPGSPSGIPGTWPRRHP